MGLWYSSSGSSPEAGPSRAHLLELLGSDPKPQRVPPSVDVLLTPWSFMYKPQALQTGFPSAFLLHRVVLVVWQLVQQRPARLDEDFETSKQTLKCTHRSDELASFLSCKNEISKYTIFLGNVKHA